MIGDDEKVRVYRAYRDGDITADEARAAFGDDADEFDDFIALMEIVQSTTTNVAPDNWDDHDE